MWEFSSKLGPSPDQWMSNDVPLISHCEGPLSAWLPPHSIISDSRHSTSDFTSYLYSWPRTQHVQSTSDSTRTFDLTLNTYSWSPTIHGQLTTDSTRTVDQTQHGKMTSSTSTYLGPIYYPVLASLNVLPLFYLHNNCIYNKSHD